jgi:hypothetical protein
LTGPGLGTDPWVCCRATATIAAAAAVVVKFAAAAASGPPRTRTTQLAAAAALFSSSRSSIANHRPSSSSSFPPATSSSSSSLSGTSRRALCCRGRPLHRHHHQRQQQQQQQQQEPEQKEQQQQQQQQREEQPSRPHYNWMTDPSTVAAAASVRMSVGSHERNNALGYPKLVPQRPVPSDIDISQALVRGAGILAVAELARQYVYLSTGLRDASQRLPWDCAATALTFPLPFPPSFWLLDVHGCDCGAHKGSA